MKKKKSKKPIRTWRVWGIVSGSKYLGTVKARTKNGALDKAEEMEEGYVSLCHQCSSQCEDPSINSYDVLPEEE